MSSFEQLFSSTELDVVVPNTSLEFPPTTVSADEWLENLRSGSQSDRKEAFFDEHIQAVLTARVPHPSENQPIDVSDPPALLLSFLSHLQVSLEASYISPDVPDAAPETQTPRTDTLLPPRTASLKGKKPLNLSLSPNSAMPKGQHHPSILPPATPNPMPASTDTDRRYAQSEGVMLCTRIWGAEGSNTFEDEDEETRDGDSKAKKVEAKPQEAFHLMWSEKEKVWVAAYKVVFTPISGCRSALHLVLLHFFALHFRPRCGSIQWPSMVQKNPLAKYIASTQSATAALAPSSDTIPSPTSPRDQQQDRPKGGLAEVNLFGGLYSFASSSRVSEDITANAAEGELDLPSTRLGSSMRSSLFLLPGKPASSSENSTPTTAQLSPMQTPGGHLKPAHPTLRKSYRKTLYATSGFRVRMRTVFVPAVLFEDDDESDEGYESSPSSGIEGKANISTGVEGEDAEEPLTSGSEERTVVICVEIENEQDYHSNSSDYSGRNAGGFLIERVDVSIGGGESEGARARLVSWGADALLSQKQKGKDISDRFPLILTPREQFNLLYAVSFLRSPEEVDGLSTLSLYDGVTAGSGTMSGGLTAPKHEGLQRSVTLNIFGKPCYASSTESSLSFYPTTTFCTRWNCILDLATTALLDRNLEDEYFDTPTAGLHGDGSKHPALNPSALPEPASPFPVPIASPRPTSLSGTTLASNDQRRASLATTSKGLGSSRSSSPSLTAGSLIDTRRHTLPGVVSSSSSGSLIKAATAGARNSLTPSMSPSSTLPDRRDSLGLPPRDRRDSGGPRSGATSPFTYTPPSTALQAQIPRSPTTYEAPPPPPFKDRNSTLAVAIPTTPGPMPGPSLDQMMMMPPMPMTPAYPAFAPNASLPPTPPSQGPYIPQGGANVSPRQGSYTGPAVDIRREKGGLGMGMMSGIPQTPAPHVGFSGGGPPPGAVENVGGGGGLAIGGLGGGVVDPIVVSVGLVREKEEKILPSDRFTLDIFVFNKSDWTRRFEISCPDPRLIRKRNEARGIKSAKDFKGRSTPGIVALQNRIRVGFVVVNSAVISI
ncbi:hypothetical protein VNI00_014955 [Paramarasmius palmivorus]|uniref:Uncharacterized protein n=1 Tax=Paramarasmius palmivorus TaxID=297713 RepID=A0AAW0BPT2_9AGAR